MQKKPGRRILAGILTPLALISVLSVCTPVHAEENTSDAGTSAIYELSSDDPNPLYTLKKEIIQEYTEKNPKLTMDSIDLDASSIQASQYNRSQTGLQNINTTVHIVAHPDENTVSTYSHNENIIVKTVRSDGPQIVLKASEVTVSLGSVFNYADNIGILSSADGSLPAITEDDNVDVNTEGTYTVNLTAFDQTGNKTSTSYTVVVQKPAEQQRKEYLENVDYMEDGVYTDADFRARYEQGMLNAAAEGGYQYYFQKDPTVVQCVDLVKYMFYRQYGEPCASTNGNMVVTTTAAMYPSQFIVSSTPQEHVFFSTWMNNEYGHTGYINRIDGDTIYITEANIPKDSEVYVRINYAMSLSDFLARGSYDFLIPVSQ